MYNDNPQPIKAVFDFLNFQTLEDDQWQLYEGDLLNSKKDGSGKLVLSNGESFEG